MASIITKRIFKHLEKIYIYLCLAIIVICCIVVGYWYIYPEKVLTITAPITTDKLVYKPGERITYTFSYCKTKEIPSVVMRSIVNGTRITFSAFQSNLAIGCHTVKISDLIIPDYVDNDTYHLEGSGEYEVNPIRHDRNSWRSNDFKVIKEDIDK